MPHTAAKHKISPDLGFQALLIYCLLRLLWLFLRHMGSKCNLAVLLFLIIELAVRCYGKHAKKNFPCLKMRIFFILKCMGCFVHLCIDQMKTTTNASTVDHEAGIWALELYMSSLLYIKSFLIAAQLIFQFYLRLWSGAVRVCLSKKLKQLS